MLTAKIGRQREGPFKKAGGGGDRIWRDRRKDQPSFFLDQLDLRPRFQAEFAAKVLGDQHLPFFRELGNGHHNSSDFEKF